MRNSKNLVFFGCFAVNLISIWILSDHYLCQRFNKSTDQSIVVKPPEFKIQPANFDLVIDGKETAEPSDHMKILEIRLDGKKLVLPFLKSDEIGVSIDEIDTPFEIALDTLKNGEPVERVTYKILSANLFKIMLIQNSRNFDKYTLQFVPAAFRVYPESGPMAQWKFSLQSSGGDEILKSYWHNPSHVSGLSEFSHATLIEFDDKNIPTRMNYKSQIMLCNGKEKLKIQYNPVDFRFESDVQSAKTDWSNYSVIPVSDSLGQCLFLGKVSKNDPNSFENKTYQVNFLNRRDIKGNYLSEYAFDITEVLIGEIIQNGMVRYLPPAWLKDGIYFPKTKKSSEGYSIRMGGNDIVGLDVDDKQQTLFLPLMAIVKNGMSDRLDLFTRNLHGKEYQLEKIWTDPQGIFIHDFFQMIQQRNISLQKIQGILADDTLFHFLQYQYPNGGKQWGYIFYIEPALTIPHFPQTVPAPKQVCLKYFIDPKSGQPTIYPEKEWKVGVYTPTMKEYAVFFDRLTYLETAFGNVLVAVHVEDNQMTVKFEDHFPQAGMGAFFMTFEMQNNAWIPTLVATDFRPSKDISTMGWKDVEKVEIKIQSGKMWQFHLYKNGEMYAKYIPDVSSKDPNRNVVRVSDRDH